MTDDRLSGHPAAAPAGIAFAASPSSLGKVLVARRSDGVCAILLGESDERLVRELGAIFPDAPREKRQEALRPELAAAVALAEKPWTGFQPPLAIGGTPFQMRVWAALRDIPAGATISYAEIARRIGAPSALRAVAGACAANILAIAIPCHRVLRSDGTLSGYRWGLERKRMLIDREKRATAT
ncbi:methylated-DNA--[protein]-cysteine S-methyltransferase [Rhodoblastus sp.]|uniref:methylated-DNA--[protein]-cysteine S-methyltransferase n=1 Tax=Rhodoblastus sp. TaxID=1962975 RepID=UPI003F9B6D4F